MRPLDYLSLGICAVMPLWASTAQANPSLNPHDHVLIGFEDPAGGGAGVNHTHWDPAFPLYPGNGQILDETPGSPISSAGKNFVNNAFDAYSAWDQNGDQALYRNGDAVRTFAHGFIRQSVPYGFGSDVPSDAMNDFNDAIRNWVADAKAMFLGYADGLFAKGREFGMNFEPGGIDDMNFNGLLDAGEDGNKNGVLDGFTVSWSNAALLCGGISAYACWSPDKQNLEFDGTTDWFYGGEGNVPFEDLNFNSVIDAGEDVNANGRLDSKTDFYTIAMHEIGHIIGLNHINTGVDGALMRTDIWRHATPGATGGIPIPRLAGLRDPDDWSLYGSLALYTQPVPEPETYAMLLAGLGLLAFMARRSKRNEAAIA